MSDKEKQQYADVPYALLFHPEFQLCYLKVYVFLTGQTEYCDVSLSQIRHAKKWLHDHNFITSMEAQ